MYLNRKNLKDEKPELIKKLLKKSNNCSKRIKNSFVYREYLKI